MLFLGPADQKLAVVAERYGYNRFRPIVFRYILMESEPAAVARIKINQAGVGAKNPVNFIAGSGGKLFEFFRHFRPGLVVRRVTAHVTIAALVRIPATGTARSYLQPIRATVPHFGSNQGRLSRYLPAKLKKKVLPVAVEPFTQMRDARGQVVEQSFAHKKFRVIRFCSGFVASDKQFSLNIRTGFRHGYATAFGCAFHPNLTRKPSFFQPIEELCPQQPRFQAVVSSSNPNTYQFRK